MGRRRVAGENGTWSLRQAFRHAGISEKTARAVARRERGLITIAAGADVAALDFADVVVLKTIAALDQAGLLADPDPQITRDRDRAAALHVRAAASRDTTVSADAHLVVTAAEARLVETAASRAAALGLYAGQPLLLLPVGAWIAALRPAPGSPATASGAAA